MGEVGRGARGAAFQPGEPRNILRLPESGDQRCLLPPCGWVQVGSVFRGTFDFEAPEFDWGPNYSKPNIPLKDLVIYEVSHD